MTSLQKVNLGTAPTGTDGDPVRTGFTKINSNVDVFNAQAALTSATGITAAQALTVAHIGKRINIALAAAGVINLPTASTCAADNVLLLRNIGTTVVTLAITAGSGDTIALSKLNPGEAALMDTDGVHAWTVLMRGRTNSDNEIVNGNCAVNGNETVGGTLGVTGLSTLTGGVSFGASGQATISADGAYSGASAAYSGNVTVGGTLGVTGASTFTARPTFNGKTPWDAGNLANPATLDTSQSFTNTKFFAASASFTGTPGGTFNNAGLIIQTSAVGAQIGFGASNGTGAGVLSLSNTSSFSFLNYNTTAYAPLTVSTLTQSSDIRLKRDVATLRGVMAKLRKLRGVSYLLKSDGSAHVGLIADEVKDVYPELVETLGLELDEDGDAIARQYDETGTEIFGPNGKPEGRKALGVRYQNMVAPLLQGLLETDELIASLIDRITKLEAK